MVVIFAEKTQVWASPFHSKTGQATYVSLVQQISMEGKEDLGPSRDGCCIHSFPQSVHTSYVRCSMYNPMAMFGRALSAYPWQPLPASIAYFLHVNCCRALSNFGMREEVLINTRSKHAHDQERHKHLFRASPGKCDQINPVLTPYS